VEDTTGVCERGLSAQGSLGHVGEPPASWGKVAGLGSRLTQEPWRGPGGLPPGHEPETETTNDGSQQGTRTASDKRSVPRGAGWQS